MKYLLYSQVIVKWFYDVLLENKRAISLIIMIFFTAVLKMNTEIGFISSFLAEVFVEDCMPNLNYPQCFASAQSSLVP